MTDESQRHLSAIVALVLGSFLGLTLLPVHLTGPLGESLGHFLWRSLGVGALGFPLLGLGLGLAGFDRLPRLDMKRAAILVVGLAVLVPFLVGVVTGVQPQDFDSAALPPRLTGVLPGFLSYYVVQAIGVAGGALLGFALLCALTILTIAWHPLNRLARVSDPVEDQGTKGMTTVRAKPSAPTAPKPVPPAEEDEPPFPLPPKRKEKAKKAPKPIGEIPLGDPLDENMLPPIDLLAVPPAHDRDAGQAELDRLGLVLLETLKTFKVEGSIAGRTTGPVVTQFEVVPAPWREGGPHRGAGGRHGDHHAGPVDPGGADSGEGRRGGRDSQPDRAHGHPARTGGIG